MNSKYDFSKFINCLNEFNIHLSDAQFSLFENYYELLIEWNSFMNLTAITDWEDVVLKHFVDSVSIIKAVPDINNKCYSIIDIGTGAGFPGIPIKIAFPNVKVTLLDSLNKRVSFLNEVISKLELDDIHAFHGRAEDFGQDLEFREKFDLGVSRAVANMAVLSELSLPFISVGGRMIFYKSEKYSEEYADAKNAVSILGGCHKENFEFILPQSDIYRNLFVIDKVYTTPKKYPRKAGTPSKSPII